MLEFDLNKMLFNVPADKHGKEDEHNGMYLNGSAGKGNI